MANTIAVYDLVDQVTVKKISVGYSPKRLIAGRDSVFVANYDDASVSVVKGGLFHVVKVIPVRGSNVLELAIAEKQRLLFVGTGDCRGSLAVINLASNRMTGRVELGTSPLGIVAVQ